MTTRKEVEEAYNNGQREFIDVDLIDGEDFSGINLQGSTFKQSYFYTRFKNANLKDCQFISCNLKTCIFEGADLTNAVIKDCAVESIVLKGANHEGLVFENNSAYGVDLTPDEFKLFL
jgi:uncharacterized protein YjbI with pentapeptide repeats